MRVITFPSLFISSVLSSLAMAGKGRSLKNTVIVSYNTGFYTNRIFQKLIPFLTNISKSFSIALQHHTDYVKDTEINNEINLNVLYQATQAFHFISEGCKAPNQTLVTGVRYGNIKSI